MYRSDEAIITNISVLGSEDHTCNSCDKNNKELSEHNEICLEIYSLASLIMSDDVDAIHAKVINPHDIMRIPVPKGSGGANTTCPIMISESIGSATSSWILRVLFDSGSNRSLIHKRVLPEAASITSRRNLNPTTTLGGTVQLNQTVTLEQLCFPEFNKNIKIDQHEMIIFDANFCYDVILGKDFL